MSMRLTILGSGSPEAYARRASSGYLLEIGGDRILLDCGGGVFDRLVQSGRKPSDLTHIIFSHLHSDHMMDYARLVHAAWDEGGAPIQVFGPAPIASITEKLFGRDGALAHDLRARTELPPSQEVWVARGGTLPRPWPEPRVTEVKPGFSIDGDGWHLDSCEVPHAQPILDCMGFAITAGGAKFVYSGDAGPCAALEQLCADADLLLHWCYRLSDEEVPPAMASLTPTPVDIARMAQRCGVKWLLLSHFRVHMDAEARHHRANEELAANFDGPAEITEDLTTYEV